MTTKEFIALREKVIIRGRRICQYCGIHAEDNCTSRGTVVDHMNNRADCMSNLCVSCRSCNSSKGNHSLVGWLIHSIDKAKSNPLNKLYIDRVERLALLISLYGSNED